MIIGIICTVLITLFALWQTWSRRIAESACVDLMVRLGKQKALLVEMAEVIGSLHRAAIAEDADTMLAVLKAANARYGAEP